MLALVGISWAGSLAGTSIPSVGGSFAGPTEPGALGILTQPAASVRGPAPELSLDLAAVYTSLRQRLQGWEQTEISSGVAAQPTVAVAIPLGRFGLGASIHGDYIRGTDYGDTPHLRMFGISSDITLLQLDVSGSVRATKELSFGAGLRGGRLTYASTKGTDLGATLNNSTAIEPPLPVGDPLLQGTQQLGPLSTYSASFFLGASLELDVVQLDFSYRPQWAITTTGSVQLIPANALNTQVDGTLDITVYMPAHLLLAGRIPVGERWTFVPEVEWVGWKRASKNRAVISDLQLTSTDPGLNSLLSASGLSEADFIKSQEGEQDVDLGWNDVINGSLQGLYQAREDLQIRGGLGYSPNAIPDAVVTPSNLDFGAMTFRVGAAWQPKDFIRLGLSGERYQTFTRRITTSPHSLTDPEPGNSPLPTGNGTYAFSLWRAGLTVQLFVPQKQKDPS